MRAALATAFVALFVLPAAAGRYIVQRGETLEHVAKAHHCSTEEVMRANGVDTTLLRPGTVIRIPACTVRSRAQVREDRTKRTNKSRVDSTSSSDDRARHALSIIDGTSVVRGPDEAVRGSDNAVRGPDKDVRGPDNAVRESDSTNDRDGISESVGSPSNGRLVGGERLPSGDGYRIRRPHRAFGAAHVVEHLRRTIAGVRAMYPDVHTLAIGDLSARGGGKISDHLSHQSGLDVDLGLYFTEVPDGYPDRFVAANDQLDLEAMWALLTAFARTTHLDDGVSVIFLDESIQERLHRWARKRGVPDEQLGEIFQYPRPRDSLAGLVRHWPNHADHLHVRFKAGSAPAPAAKPTTPPRPQTSQHSRRR